MLRPLAGNKHSDSSSGDVVGIPFIALYLCLQVQQYMDRLPEGPGTASALKAALTGLANACEQRSLSQNVVLQLQDSAYGIRARHGQAGISRKLVRTIFVDFVRCVMGTPIREQQIRLRSQRGKRNNWDNTYAIGASLSAVAQGRPTRYRASVCTVTGEDGYVWAMYLAPDDTQGVPTAVFCGLHGAELPVDLADLEYLECVRRDVAANGRVGHFPYIYSTDKSHADKNMWVRHAREVVAAWRESARQVVSVMGAHPPYPATRTLSVLGSA